MVVHCDIEFDQNPTGTYYAGQLVSGKIVLKCDKVKEAKAILLKISGSAETLWSERHFSTRRMYYGREDYLSSSTYLMGSEQSKTIIHNCLEDGFCFNKIFPGPKASIAVGVHTYTFACQLPYNCPSSFEGVHGHIRYTVKVVLQRPWKFDNVYNRAFTVLRVTDLNFESPQIRIPSTSEAYKTFCCGPCTTEPLKMELKVPQTGYVPGQNIPVQGIVINNTNMAVSEVKFMLVMLVRYTSNKPHRINVQRVAVSKIKSDSVLRYCTRAMKEELHVPATPPTCIQGSSVIQIVYQIEMYCKMKSLNKTQVVTMPVIIGNVPLANNTRRFNVIDEQPTSSSRDIREVPSDADESKEVGSPPTLDLSTPNMPPPSYEESVHTQRSNINEGEEHTFGPSEFAPLYPVFNISTPSLDQTPLPMGIENKSFSP
ncbi:arrestin domain-containing protein 17-like [Musca vetustissima]|uniref:arrestin domain-containing protein 17-like n=1 Tax=Musca vetustissima TaxID=27455 RepID=UPI002AB7DDA3|nr:arrestin domain-containing protein 17-like [Musca vetustissima]